MKGPLWRIPAAVLALCALILLVDYAIARWQLPRQDARILQLQKEVREDAAKAIHLEAFHKSVTGARAARKLRVSILAWIMIAAGASFLVLIPGKKKEPIALPRLKEQMGSAPPRLQLERSAGGEPAPLDLSVVDAIVERLGRDPEAAIPILQAIQTHFRYLPEEALRRVCEITSITPAQIAGTSSFYTQFRKRPVGRHVVRVCHGTACHVSGARQISEEIHRTLEIPAGDDTDPGRDFTVVEVACLGCCSLAPVVMVDDQTAGKLSAVDAREMFPARPKV